MQATTNGIHSYLEVLKATSNTVDDCITTSQSAFLLFVETLDSTADRVRQTQHHDFLANCDLTKKPAIMIDFMHQQRRIENSYKST